MRYNTDHLKTNKQFMIGNGILAFGIFIIVGIFIYISFRSRGGDENSNFTETYSITLLKGFVGDSVAVMVNDSTFLEKRISEEPVTVNLKRFAENSSLLIIDYKTEKLSVFELSEKGGTYKIEREGENVRLLPKDD